jgi:hypothetical protein
LHIHIGAPMMVVISVMQGPPFRRIAHVGEDKESWNAAFPFDRAN